MFFNILRMESAKIFQRRLLWIGLIITVLPMVGGFIGFFAASSSHSSAQYWIWPGGLTSALAFANGYAPGYGYAAYLIAVVIGIVTAQEYSWRTMQLWLSHGIPRAPLLLIKLLLSLGTALVILLGFLLVGGITSLFLTYQFQGNLDLKSVDLIQLLFSYLRTTFGLFPYIALTFFLVIVTRSAAVAIGGVILFMLALELPLTFLLPLLGGGLARSAQYLPASLASAMNSQNYAGAHLTTTVWISAGHPDPLIAALCILLYTAVLFGISLWVFQRQNLTN